MTWHKLHSAHHMTPLTRNTIILTAAEMRALEAKHHEQAPLFAVKRLFVQRKAMNTHRADHSLKQIYRK